MKKKTFIINLFKNSKVIFLVGTLLYLFSLYIYSYIYNSNEVVFLDVGEGDAELIKNNYGYIIIDGGPNKKVLFEMSKFMFPWERNIDLMIASHPHADHITGLMFILDRYNVKKVVVNKVCFESNNWNKLIKKGEQCQSKKYEGLVLTCMPLGELKKNCRNSLSGNVNNAGIIVNTVINNKRFLFMGDAEFENERFLIKENRLEHVDILKAGHHCSKTSSSIQFLKYIKPQIAICSVGKHNKFHHPSNVILSRFKENKIDVKRTDVDGSIVIN